MARVFRRRSAAKTTEGRIEAAAIQSARRRGMTNREIASRLGINERTVRKIVAGETSGTRIYAQRVTSKQPKERVSSPNLFRADLRLGYDDDGFPIVRSINVKLPDVPGPTGPRAPTYFDILRFPDLESVAARESEAMTRRYGEHVARVDPELVSLRPVAVMRKTPITIRGLVA